MSRVLFNFVSIILLAPALFTFVYQGFLFVVAVSTWEATQWFFGGSALSLFVYVLFLWGRFDFVEDLLHELEHTVLYFLRTFRWPTRMEIDPQQGSATYMADRGCLLLLLAPYYFPLFTVPLLLVRVLISLAFPLLGAPCPRILAIILDLLIGATFVFHLACTCQEFRFYQSDIRRTGRIASVIAVLFLNSMFVVVIFTVIMGAYEEFVDYLRAALPATQEAYQAVFDFGETRVLPTVSNWIGTLRD